MQLALTIRYQLRPATEYLPPAERALELAERVSERERYYILGSYHEMLGMAAQAARDEDLATIEYEQAVTVLEALLRLYPDHYWGTSHLGYANERLGRMEEAWRWRARRADLRPTRLPQTVNLARHFLVIGDVAAAEPYLERVRTLASAEGADPIHVVQASILHARYFLGIGDVAAAKPFVELARALASAKGTHPRWVVRASSLQAEYFLGIGDVAAAEPYIERARALASAEGSDGQVVQANFLKVDAAWLGGDAEQALAALNEVVASGPPQTSRARDLWLSNASLSYHMLGMLDAAHDMGLQIASEQPRCGALYFVAWARADLQAARDPLQCVARPAASGAGNRTRALILLARAGAPEEAREVLEWWKAQPVDPPTVMGLSPARVVAALMRTVRGELARLEGRLGEAIPLLEQGLAELQLNNPEVGTFGPLDYLVSDSLALAWLAQGEPPQAARVLDEAAQRFPVTMRTGFSWLTVELRRAQVYRQLGRVEEAEQIEAGLRTLLAHADPDHVILRALKRLS